MARLYKPDNFRIICRVQLKFYNRPLKHVACELRLSKLQYKMMILYILTL